MRVLLNGEGDPIPPEALPVPEESGNDFVIQLSTGDFVPADYIALGFTNYEVWCIGGAGGRGGDSTKGAQFTSSVAQQTLSSADWTKYLELIRIQDYFTSGEWDHQYIVSGNYPNPGGGSILLTMVQMRERENPTHKLSITTYSSASLFTTDQHEGMGGGGGGGGLQVVSGVLADLPSTVPVVVGAAGADAGYGQVLVHGAWTPLPEFVDLHLPTALAYPQGRLNELTNYFANMRNRYPSPRTSFSNPVAGQDGGASSFGGTLCRASGGKGGRPGKVYDHHDSSLPPDRQDVFAFDGAGGAGGKGGQTTAGGGAAGGNDVDGINGSDGTWDGTIGTGGGGGRGYGAEPGSFHDFGYTPTPVRKPGNGGQGSYSFGDTSVFGPRENKSEFIGGGGGGAHLRNHKFGSHALGYVPNGAVLLRVVKVV